MMDLMALAGCEGAPQERPRKPHICRLAPSWPGDTLENVAADDDKVVVALDPEIAARARAEFGGTGESEAIVDAIDLEAVLQLAGDGLLVDAGDALAHNCAERLRRRDWDGDPEFAEHGL
jgi:hypothetical protein